ncbi:efflux transporter, RND family, MFP subunit [Denitrovibrio acetiphilus DSM 12809]|uniref:Efflux transporter, RND family, MFP subunit n=1 Tax=Denitrovibrio acetiphilus (strain DSM 12809 / NBRC 114555 / N2460) TaxID=522772 RepID=D4H5A2_DENA2|nr:efflux RND transporter periplasmic adaptor subunit [Denitrovibrio acetiphilus]ADD67522.1 efflux transporter, RND family, MFP subunit [Denitrovibrio acetiphilus DSM 12809]
MFRKILIIISIAIFITACGDDEAAGFDPAKHVRPIKTYKVTSVKRMDVRTYPGKIRAGKKVDTSFILSGSLVVLNVKEGDYVEKGSLIAKLDDASYKHNLNTIKAQVEEATLAFQRAKKLWISNAISKADYDKAKSAYDVLQSQKELAEKSLRDTSLYAPFSGYIAKRYVDNFQTVSAGAPIASVQNIKEIEVVVNIPESLIMNSSQNLDYKAYAVFEVPFNKQYEMELKEVGTEADPVTQTYPVKFIMPSPDEITVLPGMTVAAKIVVSESYDEGEFEIPESAVFSDSSGKIFVWVLDENMTVHKREVKTDGLKNNSVLVLGGLKEGEEIASAGIQHLVEGLEVKRFEKPENLK